MKLFACLHRKVTWMNLSTATLVALLQRSPAARLVEIADEFVAASPIGALLKSAAAAVATLGAMDSMAGATTLAPSQSSPTSATVGTSISPVLFTVSNTINIGSWAITGQIAPGLTLSAVEGGNTLTGPGTLDATTPGQSDGYGGTTGGNSSTTPRLSGTPTTAGTYTMNMVAYEYGAKGGLVSNSFPFTVVVAAAGGPPPPSFTTNPSSQTISSGSTVAFNAAASGSPTYQWDLNGTAISGATKALLVINGATSANAGSYTCVATNSGGAVTSSAATLTVSNTSDVGRLIDVATRANVGTGANVLIVGFVIGGAGTTGTKPVLVRGMGPTLGSFGVPGTLPDPKLTLRLLSDSSTVASNTGWGGDSQIASVAAAVGAFSFSSPSSKDSAIYESGLAATGYTAEIEGASGDTGVALAEVYDATPSGSYTASTPRLINLSARVQVGTGANILIAGFVIGGSTSRTVLIRASGPAIAAFVPGALPDPQLSLYRTNSDGSNTLLMTSPTTGWGGDAQIASTAASVGAFAWGSPTSLDSAFLVTLPPGAYSAQVAGASGDTGISLVEVYEVP